MNFLWTEYYLVPLVLLFLHRKDGVNVVFQQLVRQLAQTGMVLRSKEKKITLFQGWIGLAQENPRRPPWASHHPGAPSIDVVFQVTQAVVRNDNSCQSAVQGEVRGLVGHQEQQTLGLWTPTHSSLKRNGPK